MISPSRGTLIGQDVFAERCPADAKASLSTSRWSPISSVSSMDPVGITKACTREVVPNNSSRMVMVHSAIVPRGGSFAAGLAGGTAGGVAGTAAGSAVTAVFPRSGVGFIASTSSVYQAEAVYQQEAVYQREAAGPREDGTRQTRAGATPRQAKYRCSAGPGRSRRRGNRNCPTRRAATATDSATELVSHCGVQGNTARNTPTSKQTMMNKKMPNL